MRIGVDARCLLEPKFSGISEYTFRLLTTLIRQNPQHQFVLFYNANRQAPTVRFDFPNVDIKEFHYPNRLFNLGMRLFHVATIDKLLGGVDTMILPNFMFLHLQPKTPRVIIVHDLSFELFPDFFTAKKRLWHTLIGPRQQCQQANAVIAISENTKRDLIQCYGLADKSVSVVYPGISDQFFNPVEGEKKMQVQKKYDLLKPYFLYVGNLEPRKNVETLIDAFGKLEEWSGELVIVGNFAWKFKSVYERWQASPARDRIRFTGYVDDADKVALYAGATAFVYPSFYEGFGLPPVEAMACGTPVITSANSSLVEAVGDAAVLIDPFDVTSLVQAMQEMVTDETLRARCIERGRAQAMKFTWKNAAEKIMPIIESSTQV